MENRDPATPKMTKSKAQMVHFYSNVVCPSMHFRMWCRDVGAGLLARSKLHSNVDLKGNVFT